MDVRNISKDGKCSCIRSMLDYGKCLVALTTGQICTQATDIPEVTTHGDNIDMSPPKTPITNFFKLPKVCVAPFTNAIPTSTETGTSNRINTPYFPLFPCKDLEKTFSQPKYNSLRRRRNAIACVTDFSSKIKHYENKRALLNNNTTRKCKKSVANGLLFSSEAVVGVPAQDLFNPCVGESSIDVVNSVINKNNEDIVITRRQKRTKRRSDDVLTRRIMELRDENKFTYTDVQSFDGQEIDVQPVCLRGHGIDMKTGRKTTSRSSYSRSSSGSARSGSTSSGSTSGSTNSRSSIGSVGRLKESKDVETVRRKRATTLPTELSASSSSGINKDVLLRRRNAIAPYSGSY